MGCKLLFSRDIKIMWVKAAFQLFHIQTLPFPNRLLQGHLYLLICQWVWSQYYFIWLLTKLIFIYENIMKINSDYIFFALIMYWLMTSYNREHGHSKTTVACKIGIILYNHFRDLSRGTGEENQGEHMNKASLRFWSVKSA